MFLFSDHRCTNALRAARNHPALFLHRPSQQKLVQLFQVLHARHRNQVVPPELATLALDATLLVTLAWRTELRFESPVRAKADEPGGLYPLMAAQDLLHRTLEVVVPQDSKYSGKIGERQLV